MIFFLWGAPPCRRGVWGGGGKVGALITAGKFLNCHGDESFIKDFDSAMYKIKSILKHGEKNYAQELENSINVYSTSGQKNTLRFRNG